MDSALFQLVITLCMALFTQRLSTHTPCDFEDVCGDIIIQLFSIYSNEDRTTVDRAHSSTSECSSLSALISTQNCVWPWFFRSRCTPTKTPKTKFVLYSSSLTSVFASIWKMVLNNCCLRSGGQPGRTVHSKTASLSPKRGRHGPIITALS